MLEMDGTSRVHGHIFSCTFTQPSFCRRTKGWVCGGEVGRDETKTRIENNNYATLVLHIFFVWSANKKLKHIYVLADADDAGIFQYNRFYAGLSKSAVKLHLIHFCLPTKMSLNAAWLEFIIHSPSARLSSLVSFNFRFYWLKIVSLGASKVLPFAISCIGKWCALLVGLFIRLGHLALWFLGPVLIRTGSLTTGGPVCSCAAFYDTSFNTLFHTTVQILIQDTGQFSKLTRKQPDFLFFFSEPRTLLRWNVKCLPELEEEVQLPLIWLARLLFQKLPVLPTWHLLSCSSIFCRTRHF